MYRIVLPPVPTRVAKGAGGGPAEEVSFRAVAFLDQFPDREVDFRRIDVDSVGASPIKIKVTPIPAVSLSF